MIIITRKAQIKAINKYSKFVTDEVIGQMLDETSELEPNPSNFYLGIA